MSECQACTLRRDYDGPDPEWWDELMGVYGVPHTCSQRPVEIYVANPERNDPGPSGVQ